MFSSITDKLKRSWLLTRITLRIVFTHDRELLVFPLVNWLLVAGASLTASFAVSRTASSAHIRMATDPGITSAVLLLLLLTITLFGLCITHTTRVRLEGGDASLWQSLGFGFRNFHRGLALTRHLGFRAISSALYFIGALIAICVVWLLPVGSTAQTIGLQVVIAYFTAVIVLFHLALYHYATRGEAGLGFSREILEGSIRREATGV